MKNSHYTPIKCANKSCAFPYVHCNNCLSSKSLHGKRALVLRDPKSNYNYCKFQNNKDQN